MLTKKEGVLMTVLQVGAEPVVELHFPVRASIVPSDHGYLLYSAISKLVPEAHAADWLGIHTMKGRKCDAGSIRIGRFAKLKIRLPLSKAPLLHRLAGAVLDLSGHELRLGVPEMHLLKPASDLRSRLVVVKIAKSTSRSADSESFMVAIRKQLQELAISHSCMELEAEQNTMHKDEYARRVVRVKTAIITGYGVILRGLSADDSIKVQQHGLGGRRRMGCGLFVPLGREG
jgi:CRISPR-associated protein Cas6